MSATPWRGTVIFVGGMAVVAATVAARFAGADASVPGSAGPGLSATTGQPGSSGAAPGSEAKPPQEANPANPAQTAQPGGTVDVVGSTVQTRYGPLQLSVTFDGAHIADVRALQFPNWHGESVRINNYAIPILTQEAIAAGSAQIDAVSGATITSDAFRQSLQAAIDAHG